MLIYLEIYDGINNINLAKRACKDNYVGNIHQTPQGIEFNETNDTAVSLASYVDDDFVFNGLWLDAIA